MNLGVCASGGGGNPLCHQDQDLSPQPPFQRRLLFAACLLCSLPTRNIYVYPWVSEHKILVLCPKSLLLPSLPRVAPTPASSTPGWGGGGSTLTPVDSESPPAVAQMTWALASVPRSPEAWGGLVFPPHPNSWFGRLHHCPPGPVLCFRLTPHMIQIDCRSGTRA